MTAPHLVSHARNGEDVVLWRALHDVANGRYVQVGTGSTDSTGQDSITQAFRDAGWRGIELGPDAAGDRQLAELLAATDLDPTAIHFMAIHSTRSPRTVLEGVDLAHWRPWVLVIESATGLTNGSVSGEWEDVVLAAGYQFCLFDGRSRFYVAAEHADRAPRLGYPACVLDDYDRAATAQTQRDAQQLQDLRDALAATERALTTATDEVTRWRAMAIENLARNGSTPAVSGARGMLDAKRTTVSRLWQQQVRKARKLARRIINASGLR